MKMKFETANFLFKAEGDITEKVGNFPSTRNFRVGIEFTKKGIEVILYRAGGGVIREYLITDGEVTLSTKKETKK